MMGLGFSSMGRAAPAGNRPRVAGGGSLPFPAMTDRYDSDVAQAVASVSLFADLSKRQIINVSHLCFEAVFEPGDTIVKEGDTSTGHMLIITSGTGAVTIGDKEMGTVGPGDVVGEMALFDGLPRSASVTANEEVRAVVLYRSAFTNMLEEHPVIALKLLATLSKRLREKDARLAALS